MSSLMILSRMVRLHYEQDSRLLMREPSRGDLTSLWWKSPVRWNISSEVNSAVYGVIGDEYTCILHADKFETVSQDLECIRGHTHRIHSCSNYRACHFSRPAECERDLVYNIRIVDLVLISTVTNVSVISDEGVDYNDWATPASLRYGSLLR